MTDDVVFVDEDMVGPPRTPGQLLVDLGVFGEPKPVQRAAVVRWLEDNEPVPILRVALEHADLIDASSAA